MVNLAGKKVLVTGGTGFVGGRLAERLLLECGAEVRVLVHNWASAAWLVRLPVELVHGDVTDTAAVLDAVRGCSLVFHCASGGDDYSSYMKTNAEGTRNVLQAARESGVKRLVYVSSFVVHDLGHDGPISEDSPHASTAQAYAQSKIAAEAIVRQYGADHGLPVTIIRPTFVWGPRGMQYSVGPAQAIRKGAFRLLDGGAAACPAVYIDNLVDALLLASAKDEAIGEDFLITDGPGQTWRDFFGAYASMLGVVRLQSLNTSSAYVRIMTRCLDSLDRSLVKLSPNPAPIWRRAIRRGCRILRDRIQGLGIPSRRSLSLYSRKGGVSSRKAEQRLGYVPRIGLAEGMAVTKVWLADQVPALRIGNAGDSGA